MQVKHVANCPQIIANDGSLLRELLSPLRDAVMIRYSIAHATVNPRSSTHPHRLRSAEVYYIISGEGTMHIADEACTVTAGHLIYIPPGAVQWIENIGNSDLVFLCIVDPPWRPEDDIPA